jgi:uncharacterized protein
MLDLVDDFTRAPAEMVESAVVHVKTQLREQSIDSSHDFWHIHRVCALSLQLARMSEYPGISGLESTIQLCATLHDLSDWKYTGCDKAGPKAVRAFLESQKADSSLKGVVLFVIENIGFKESLGRGIQPAPCKSAQTILEIVQDADRLDAMGVAPASCEQYCFIGSVPVAVMKCISYRPALVG